MSICFLQSWGRCNCAELEGASWMDGFVGRAHEERTETPKTKQVRVQWEESV